MTTDIVPATVTLPDGRVIERARLIADDRRVVVFAQDADGTAARMLDRPILAVLVPHDPLAPLRRQRVEIATTLGSVAAVRERTCGCRIKALRRINAAAVLAEK